MGFPLPCCPMSGQSPRTSDTPKSPRHWTKDTEIKMYPETFFVRMRGTGENIVNKLVLPACVVTIPSTSPLSLFSPFSSISLKNMSPVLHHLLFEENDLSDSLLISFAPFYLFHPCSSLFHSHPAMNQDLCTALSPECVWEQKFTSHLKMTSSFYAAANQMQAHGTLPSWRRYVHKIGRQRCRIKDKSNLTAKCSFPLE